ncbi:MAG: DUF3352 domain-containing protein [Chloroflexota bacterium]
MDIEDRGPDPPPRKEMRLPSQQTVSIAVLSSFILILAAGLVAFAVPLVNVGTGKDLGHMLPASTVAYVSLDLNPSGSSGTNWNRIVHAFTNQPGWQSETRTFDQLKGSSPNSSDCYQQTEGQISSHLGQLGHASAIALVPAPGMHPLATGAATTIKQSIVFLAALHVRMTIIQVVSAFPLTIPHQTETYRGVPIYRETFPECGAVNAAAPQAVYAAVDQGYVLLGLLPAPIKRVIDTAAGKAPDLASTAVYSSLMKRVTPGGLATYYLNGAAFSRLGVGQLALPSTTTPSARTESSAASVYAEAHGLRVLAIGSSPAAGASASHSAGLIAKKLPADTLGLLSLGSGKAILNAVERSARGLLSSSLSGLFPAAVTPLIRDFSQSMSGELDLALETPSKPLTLSGVGAGAGLPLSLLWQVSSPATAQRDMTDLVRRLLPNARFRLVTLPDGATYRVTVNRYGYAVRNGWAVMSLSIPGILQQLSTPPSAPLAATVGYQHAISPGTKPGSLFLLNVQGLRLQFENSLLPGLNVQMRTQYQSYVQPLLAPIQTISESTGNSGNGKYSVSTAFIGIG